MAARKTAFRSKALHRNRGGDLKDEVYRQMFRLEESRPGAEMGLALALLRAWLAAESNPESGRRSRLAEQDIPNLSSDDRGRLTNGRRHSSRRAGTPVLNVLPGKPANFRENPLSSMHSGEYTDLAHDDPLRCDLN